MERGKMPTTNPTDFFGTAAILNFLKAAILIISIFYAIFAVMIVRQVSLMSKTLISKISPVIRAAAIIHAGFAIGLIILVWGIL